MMNIDLGLLRVEVVEGLIFEAFSLMGLIDFLLDLKIFEEVSRDLTALFSNFLFVV